MKSFEQMYSSYGGWRKSHGGGTEDKRLEYDFTRLLDATWSLKSIYIEEFGSSKRPSGAIIKHDIFRLIMVCSRYISESAAFNKSNTNLLDCWALFKNLLDLVLIKGDILSYDQCLPLARLLFIAALVFDMPPASNIENIVSNPHARRIIGTYPANADDIEFSKTLPGDLKGPFESTSDVLINLKKNLQYYHDKI